jgi:hypothetical protein
MEDGLNADVIAVATKATTNSSRLLCNDDMVDR